MAGTAQPRIQVPTLEEIAAWVWECEAFERTGDADAARRWTAARYWAETRRPNATAHRVVDGPGWPRGHKCDGG